MGNTNSLQRPVWQLTVGEFLELVGQQKATDTVIQPPQARKYVYCIDGLRNLLQCSRTTAATIKASGVLNGCFSQVGRKIVFDADAVLAKLQK